MKLRKLLELKIDLIDKKKELVIYTELPGLSINDLIINHVGRYLIIEGEKKRYGFLEDVENNIESKLEFGYFKEYIAVPPDIDLSKMVVTLRDGILLISVPR